MAYRIEERPSFNVIGLETTLTTRHSDNLIKCKAFWRQFNADLKRTNLSQSQHWVKYAFTYKRGQQYFYYCSIPRPLVIPEAFSGKTIVGQKYMVFEHVGPMELLYKTYNHIYRDVMPHCPYVSNNKDFLHFEKYDARFGWSRADSVIEIWLPIADPFA